MRMEEAKRFMFRQHGFRVHFEERQGCMLVSGFFPERDEEPIQSEQEAWGMAWNFADNAPERFINIYVIRADNFTPVDGYRSNMRRKYP